MGLLHSALSLLPLISAPWLHCGPVKTSPSGAWPVQQAGGQSQTERARKLKFWENIHLTLCVMCHVSVVMCHVSLVMCHVSPVMCHVSPVTCHVSPITCHVSPVTCNFFILKNIGQIGGASQWRVCYQCGLPRLVSWNTCVTTKLVRAMTGVEVGGKSLSLNASHRFSVWAKTKNEKFLE